MNRNNMSSNQLSMDLPVGWVNRPPKPEEVWDTEPCAVQDKTGNKYFTNGLEARLDWENLEAFHILNPSILEFLDKKICNATVVAADTIDGTIEVSLPVNDIRGTVMNSQVYLIKNHTH